MTQEEIQNLAKRFPQNPFWNDPFQPETTSKNEIFLIHEAFCHQPLFSPFSESDF